MSQKSYIHYYAQPWPYCWLKMQWDLALWSSRWHADPGLRMHVVWSEALLESALLPDQFRLETEEFMHRLQTINGSRASWEVRRTEEATGHAVQLHWERRTKGLQP
jgi:hypothetical protein